MSSTEASSNTTTSGRPAMFIVEVLYNFFPSDKQHLTLSQYEKIKVIETHKSDWWIGEKSNGEVGLFPANYVRRVQDMVEESPRRREKTFNKPVTFDPKKTTKTVDPQLQKRKEIASQLGLGTVDWDELMSDDDEEEEVESDDDIVPEKKPSPVTKTQSTTPVTAQPTNATNQTMTNNNPAGKFVTEEAYDKKKKDLQEALQKQMEDQMIKQKQMEEIKKLKEELLKTKTEASNKGGEEKSTTPRTTPRSTPGLSNQEVQQLMQKQQADFEKKQADIEKKQKDMEKEYEAKLKQAIEKSSQNATTTTEMQKAIEKLKQKNSQLEGQVVTLDKSLTDVKQKYNTDVKDLSHRLKEQKEGAMKHVGAKMIRVKKQVQAIKFENGYLKKEALDMQKEFLSAVQLISSKGMKKLLDGYKDLEDQYKKEIKERRILYNQLQDLKGNIRVNLRIRPLLPEDGQSPDTCIETLDEREIKVTDKDGKKTYKFEFDNVFGINSTQEQVFEDVKPLSTSILDGYNVCIFAYGQTGSGKTFTMEGPPSNRGVNYRTLDELFAMVKERKGEYSYEVEVAVMEIYNETLYDLLSKEKTKLDIMLSNKVAIPNLTKVKVSSSDDVRKVLSQGYENRAVGNNNINAHSSRSHCIVSVFVEGVNTYTNQKVAGKLHLIDLAGSERLKRTDVKGDRLKEAQSINLSLSNLGDVISALATKKSHIPYRNSKLTSLLQDSLGGNSKMLMFVNVNPTVESCPETICSLGFAQRARKVELGKAEKNVSAAKQ